MSQLRDKIVARIDERVDFKNDALQGLISAHATGTFNLADAIATLEKECQRLGLDPITVSDAAIGLAEQFGDAFPAPGPDRTQAIKDLVNQLIDEDDPALEAALEDVFSKMLDFEVGTSALNSGVDAIVPE